LIVFARAHMRATLPLPAARARVHGTSQAQMGPPPPSQQHGYQNVPQVNLAGGARAGHRTSRSPSVQAASPRGLQQNPLSQAVSMASFPSSQTPITPRACLPTSSWPSLPPWDPAAQPTAAMPTAPQRQASKPALAAAENFQAAMAAMIHPQQQQQQHQHHAPNQYEWRWEQSMPRNSQVSGQIPQDVHRQASAPDTIGISSSEAATPMYPSKVDTDAADMLKPTVWPTTPRQNMLARSKMRQQSLLVARFLRSGALQNMKALPGVVMLRNHSPRNERRPKHPHECAPAPGLSAKGSVLPPRLQRPRTETRAPAAVPQRWQCHGLLVMLCLEEVAQEEAQVGVQAMSGTLQPLQVAGEPALSFPWILQGRGLALQRIQTTL